MSAPVEVMAIRSLDGVGRVVNVRLASFEERPVADTPVGSSPEAIGSNRFRYLAIAGGIALLALGAGFALGQRQRREADGRPGNRKLVVRLQFWLVIALSVTRPRRTCSRICSVVAVDWNGCGSWL